ncbi:hypothetical protein GCM10007863_27090 [Dyella mobilis]|nr:hypothetical protein GCM10007863_27090 [Dyella mobilis]
MGSQVDFLVFGYSSVDGQPWAAKVRCGSDKNAELVEFKNPLESQNLQCVGDVGERLTFRKAIKDIRTRIQRHSKRIRPRKGFDARMDAELEAARHESADKKAIENLVIREIRKASNETVGGVVQKAEAILCDDYRCVVTFSKDDQDYILDGLPPAGDGLSYIPIVEKIGG